MSVAIESLLFAASEVEIVAAPKVPTVNIFAYTGGLMSVSGWGPIVVDLKSIDASAEQIGILADHDASLKGTVGHGGAFVANGRLMVQGSLTPSTEASKHFIDLARGGFRFQASVGIVPTEYDRIRPGEPVNINGKAITSPASGITLVRAGVLKEVSIIVIGANAGTLVSIAANTKGVDMLKEVTVEAKRPMRANAYMRSVSYAAVAMARSKSKRSARDGILNESNPRCFAHRDRPFSATTYLQLYRCDGF